MVRHLAIIDADLKLALPSLAGVHAELARLTNNSTLDIRNLDQTRVICLEKYWRVLNLDPRDVDVHDETANLLGVELNFKQAIVLQKPEI